MFVVDKVIIEIIVSLIAGSGLFSVMTKFYSKELNDSFFGENPFGIKRDIVDKVNTYIFTCLSFIGISIHIVSTIFNIKQERLYSSSSYLILFIVGLTLTFILIYILNRIGNYIAKKRWLPIIVETYKDVIVKDKFILENNGLREDQLSLSSPTDDTLKKYREANIKSVKQHLESVEKLLELSKIPNNLNNRIDAIEKLFCKYDKNSKG